MSTYIIGDVHGHFDHFQELLKKVKYSPTKDKIILTGDLVNRGPQSLAMLNYCMSSPSVKTVLGNHDLYLLYLMSIGKGKGKLKSIVAAQNRKKIFKWLLRQPLLIKIKSVETKNTFFITHAGIPEIWSPSKAQKLAREASNLLKKNPKNVLRAIWGDHPKTWADELRGEARVRIIINYFTRMRFTNNECKLDLKNTSLNPKKNFKPWFQYVSTKHEKKNYFFIFGHWASLNGKTRDKHFIGLDTGCAWKGKLTAIRLEDLKKFSIKC